MMEEYSIEIEYVEEYAITMDHRQIVLYDIDSSTYVRTLYNVTYSIDNKESTSNYIIEPSLFDSRYIVFENSEGRVWYLG